MLRSTSLPTIIRPDYLELPQAEYTIRQLRVMFGITSRTIRFYCEFGLLQTSRCEKERQFDRRNVRRLALVRTGVSLGLSLHDISTMLRNCDADPDQAYLELSAERIDHEIATLEKQRTETAKQLRLLLACQRSAEPQLRELKLRLA